MNDMLKLHLRLIATGWHQVGMPIMPQRSSCERLYSYWYIHASSSSTDRLLIDLTSDRELTLVPKKGRPVTQCQHCRLERKKRSAHVKCDCGEIDKPHHPREKCIHLREAEERAKAGHHDDHPAEKDPAYLAAVAEEQGCCCHHGGKCTCAILMKETTDSAGAPHGPAVKPRLEKTTSDGAITVFTNGHHKPVHRKNHAAHECGMPYKMPLPRSCPEQDVSMAARRSVDNLTLESSMTYQSSPSALQTNVPFNTERRKSKSEQPSPKISPLIGGCNGLGDHKLSSTDFSNLAQSQTNSSMQSAASSNYFPALDAMSGLTESSFDPWSALPSAESAGMPGNNPFGVWPTSNDNNCIAQPALTAASSGTQSEIDEIPAMDDIYGFPMPSIQEDADNDMMVLPSGNSPQSNRRSLPPGFFGNTDFGIGGVTSDWQASLGDFNASVQNKLSNTPPTNLDDFWQTSGIQPSSSVPQRALGGLPFSPRPQSRSVGSSSAPNDEIIKQLFPDLELNNSMFGSTGSPQMSTDKSMGGLSKSNVTSAPIDFGPMDETVGFTTQAWSDGSMSVPNDTFTSSYDLDQDFSNPQFSIDWSQ